MKKYIKPALNVVRVTIEQHLLSTSDPNLRLNADRSVDAGSVESRGSFDWDDDDDEY